MPPKKSTKKGSQSTQDADPSVLARQKEALAAANQIRKDFKNLKLAKSAKLFSDVISKNKEFEAELKLVRLELLATIHGHEESTFDPKVEKVALREMLELIDDMAQLQPCWGHAAERCCNLLRVNAGDPEKGAQRCTQAIACIQQSRPTDDKVFLDVFSQDHEANLHRLLDFECKEDVQYLLDRLQLAHIVAMQEVDKKHAAEHQQRQESQQQQMQWHVMPHPHEQDGAKGSEPQVQLHPQEGNDVEQFMHGDVRTAHDAEQHAHHGQFARGQTEDQQRVRNGQSSPGESHEKEAALRFGTAEDQQAQQHAQHNHQGESQHPTVQHLPRGQMVPVYGQNPDENDANGDSAAVNRLQTAVIKRRNALVQLYKQGLRKPPKRSKAVNGADDKDDQAKQIRRKLIEQDIVRVKAMQLCREAGQEPQMEAPTEDQSGKRAGAEGKSHSERLQRKLAAKKEAMERNDANGPDSVKHAVRFLQKLSPEDRAEALCLPLERLEQILCQQQQVQVESMNQDGTVNTIPSDAMPSMLGAAKEHAKGHWLARSWTQGDFQRFQNRGEYLSILLTMVWRLLFQKCKADVLAHWNGDGSTEKEGVQPVPGLPSLDTDGLNIADRNEVFPWLSAKKADALPDFPPKVKDDRQKRKLGLSGDGPRGVVVDRMKRYLLSRMPFVPKEFLEKTVNFLVEAVAREEPTQKEQPLEAMPLPQDSALQAEESEVVVVGRVMEEDGTERSEAQTEENASSALSNTVVDLEALDGEEEVVKVDAKEVGRTPEDDQPRGRMNGDGTIQHNDSDQPSGKSSTPYGFEDMIHDLIATCADHSCLEKLCLYALKLQVRDELEEVQKNLTARVGSMLVVEGSMPLDCEKLLAKGYYSNEDQGVFSERLGNIRFQFQAEQSEREGGEGSVRAVGVDISGQVPCPEAHDDVWYWLHDRVDGGQVFNLGLLSETVRLIKIYSTAAWEHAGVDPSPVSTGRVPLPLDMEKQVIDFSAHAQDANAGAELFGTILQGDCMTAWLQNANQLVERGPSRPLEEIFEMYDRCELQTRQWWNEKLQEFTHRGLQWTAICKTLHQVRVIHRQVVNLRHSTRMLLEDAVLQPPGLIQFLTDVYHYMQFSRGMCHYLQQALQDHCQVLWYRLQDAFRHMDAVREVQVEGGAPQQVADTFSIDPDVQRDIDGKVTNTRKIVNALDEHIKQTTVLRERFEQVTREPEPGTVSMELAGQEPLHSFLDANLNLSPTLVDSIDTEAAEIEGLMKKLQADQADFDLFKELESIVEAGADSTIVTESINGIALAVIRDGLAERGRAEEEARAKMEQDNQAKAAEEELLQEEKRKEEQERQKREKAAKKRDKDKEKKRKEKEELERKREEEEKARREAEEKDQQLAEALKRQEEEEREATQRKAREAEEAEIERRRKELEDEAMKKITSSQRKQEQERHEHDLAVSSEQPDETVKEKEDAETAPVQEYAHSAQADSAADVVVESADSHRDAVSAVKQSPEVVSPEQDVKVDQFERNSNQQEPKQSTEPSQPQQPEQGQVSTTSAVLQGFGADCSVAPGADGLAAEEQNIVADVAADGHNGQQAEWGPGRDRGERRRSGRGGLVAARDGLVRPERAVYQPPGLNGRAPRVETLAEGRGGRMDGGPRRDGNGFPNARGGYSGRGEDQRDPGLRGDPRRARDGHPGRGNREMRGAGRRDWEMTGRPERDPGQSLRETGGRGQSRMEHGGQTRDEAALKGDRGMGGRGGAEAARLAEGTRKPMPGAQPPDSSDTASEATTVSRDAVEPNRPVDDGTSGPPAIPPRPSMSANAPVFQPSASANIFAPVYIPFMAPVPHHPYMMHPGMGPGPMAPPPGMHPQLAMHQASLSQHHQHHQHQHQHMHHPVAPPTPPMPTHPALGMVNPPPAIPPVAPPPSALPPPSPAMTHAPPSRPATEFKPDPEFKPAPIPAPIPAPAPAPAPATELPPADPPAFSDPVPPPVEAASEPPQAAPSAAPEVSPAPPEPEMTVALTAEPASEPLPPTQMPEAAPAAAVAPTTPLHSPQNPWQTPTAQEPAKAASPLAHLHLRADQMLGAREYDLVWGTQLGSALDANGEFSMGALGKGLDNPKGDYNCFLNVIIQSLWQLEGFREDLLQAAAEHEQQRKRKALVAPPGQLPSGPSEDRAALLQSLAQVFALLTGGKSGADVVASSNTNAWGASSKPPNAWGTAAPTAPAATGAWGSGPPGASAGGNAWGNQGKGRNLFVVDPTACRHSLGKVLADCGRLQLNEMADAAECLHDVFEALKECLCTGGQGSMIAKSFGLNVVERRECTDCGYSMPDQVHLAFFHYVPPARLLEVQQEAGERGERPTPEELLLRAYNVDTRPCPKCSDGSDVKFRCTSTLSQTPSVFSLVLVWTNAEAAAEDIEALFKQLPLTLDLSLVYSGLDGPQLYRMRCMVCFYGQHYVTIAFNPQIKQWVQYDDTSVKPVGDWTAVSAKCRAGRFQPHVIFFEKCA